MFNCLKTDRLLDKKKKKQEGKSISSALRSKKEKKKSSFRSALKAHSTAVMFVTNSLNLYSQDNYFFTDSV